jgi:hypothetical protein
MRPKPSIAPEGRTMADLVDLIDIQDQIAEGEALAHALILMGEALGQRDHDDGNAIAHIAGDLGERLLAARQALEEYRAGPGVKSS